MKKVRVRFPNESVYHPMQIDPQYVRNARVYSDEVFFEYRGITLNMKIAEWNELNLTISNTINK